MKSGMSSLVIVIVAVTSLASAGFAAASAAPLKGSAPAVEASEANIPPFPYIAEATGDGVYVRSGPGTQYYYCGKLNKTDKVKVVGRKFSWSQIVPPAGSFSWISKQYVSIDPNNPSEGTVTGENVRVYAGSSDVKPIHSTTVQGKLEKGSRIQLLGEQQGDYYKIAPPSFAYLWVSTDYTRPLESIAAVPMTAEPNTTFETIVPPPAFKPKTEPNAPAVVPAAPPVIKNPLEVVKLREYDDLEKQIKAERTKPVDRQDYTNIKKALAEIANNKEAGKAARYAEFALGQIKRYELAREVAKEVQLQDSQLKQIREQIDKANTAKLEGVTDLGRFAVIGKFQTSNVYGRQAGPRYYRIVGDTGKTLCYAVADGPAAEMDLSRFIDRTVGLVGTIEPHPQTSGALVRFTEIVELK